MPRPAYLGYFFLFFLEHLANIPCQVRYSERSERRDTLSLLRRISYSDRLRRERRVTSGLTTACV